MISKEMFNTSINHLNKNHCHDLNKFFKTPKENIDTPAFSHENINFTTHEQMLNYIYELQKSTDNMQVHIIGKTQEDKEIPLLIFSKPSYSNPCDVLKLNKPILWFQGQIHGNEPAGGEAMLALAKELCKEFGEQVLNKVSIIIIPRINGDGSLHFQRTMADGLDSNRDHLKFDVPETILLHKVFNRFKPEVVVDAHEYSLNYRFRSVGKKGSLPYHDVLMSSAKNLNIPKEIREKSDELFVENVKKHLEKSGYTFNYYYTVLKNSKEFIICSAGADAKIGRNEYGLQPSFSFLIETRGIGLGVKNFKRRVMSHILVCKNIINTTVENAHMVKSLIDKARADITNLGNNINSHNKIIITCKGSILPKENMDIIDIYSGEKTNVHVKALSFTNAKPVLQRTRPRAYILPSIYNDVAKRLSYLGVTVRRLNKDTEIWVETFKVKDKEVDTTYYEGHFRNIVTVSMKLKKKIFLKGSYVFSMAQPTANLIAMVLEPDAEDSFVKFNIIPVDIKQEVPVYRYLGHEKLHCHIVDMK